MSVPVRRSEMQLIRSGGYPETEMEDIKDGICPECGGELKLIDTDGYELNDGDYLTPNTYVIERYIYRCADCGEIIETNDLL